MIESFNDRRLKRFYESGKASQLQPDMVDRIRTILARLDIALAINDLRAHSFRLHPLKGDRKGYWASPSARIGGLYSGLKMECL